MHGNWWWILLAVLGAVAVTLAVLAFSSATLSPLARKWDDVYTGNFTSKAVDLNLTTGNGSITCRTWSDPGYRLVAHVQALGSSEAKARRLAAESIKVEQSGDSIKVGGETGWWPKVMVSVELYLPAGPEYHLQANTGNGAVNLEGGSYATARVHTGNGSLESTALIGELEANAGNGSIHMLATGSGRWVLTSANGQVSVDTANLGETGMMVEADTTNGKIVMDIGGQRTEQSGGGSGRTPLRMSTIGYEQAHRQLFIQARTNLGKIIVLRGA